MLNLEEYKKSIIKRYDYEPYLKYFSYKDFKGLNYDECNIKVNIDAINGGFYYYNKETTNNLIVFVHGMGPGHLSYMKEIETLASKGYKIFAYDMIGTGKINPMNLSLEDLETLVRTNNSPKELSSKILGLSLKTTILAFDSENPSQKLYELIHDNTPCLYFDGKKNDITYYKVDGGTFFPSFSNLLDAYFKEEALKERIKAKTENIESFIDKQLTRNLNKKHKLEDELQKADEADKYRLYGELLIANNYLSGHKKNITVLNYYTNENVTIPLDERYDIMGNSKLYFKKYQKSKNAISHINEQLSIIEEELAYFNLLKSQIKVCDLKDALEIQQELIDNHYMILKNKPEKLQKTKITTYLLPSGHTVLVGKNNIQNDLVTNKMARPSELWFHVKDMPGSHVLLQSSDEATEEEIRTCANLAAYFSEARNSSSVPVNYTRAKNIKKIPGHKNCFVSIKGEKTIFIDPDIELINKLELKK